MNLGVWRDVILLEFPDFFGYLRGMAVNRREVCLHLATKYKRSKSPRRLYDLGTMAGRLGRVQTEQHGPQKTSAVFVGLTGRFT